jgi:lysophospholipase L1-like esterase
MLLLVTFATAEVALQATALFARDRDIGWRPGAAHQVLCLGDAHTFGGTIPVEQSYPAQLQRLLDQQAPDTYSVINLGIPGLNTTQVRGQLRAALSQYRPDLVVIWCGADNAWNRSESTAHPSDWSARLERASTQWRLYRLIRTWLHDRNLEHAFDQVVPAQQQRYDIVSQTDAREPRQHVTVALNGRVEQIEFADTGLRADAEVEEHAAKDYRMMVEASKAAGAEVLFVTYPVETDASGHANNAARRVAKEYRVALVESSASAQRLPPEERTRLEAGQLDGPSYGQIARDIVPVVLKSVAARPSPGEPALPPTGLAQLAFETSASAGDSDDPLTEATVVKGGCTRSTTNCATGTGCYRWNPAGTICNVQKILAEEQADVNAFTRLRVGTFPSGSSLGGYDVFSLFENTYGTGVYLQFTNTNEVQLLSLGTDGASSRCGPLGSRLAPNTWYGVRIRAEKSHNAALTLQLLDNDGRVLDALSCTNQTAGGGTFTRVMVGSNNPLGASGDITFDDVEVHGDPG